MMKNYQTAIVTGASHGIGPYIARALAQATDTRERKGHLRWNTQEPFPMTSQRMG
jgi:hypothetical protein